MALSIDQIAARVDSLRYRASERDARAGDVLTVRQGKISEVYPDFFPEGVDANVVANFIDIVARDLSEVMAPLPAVNCSSANQVNDRARKFADNRTRIASNYFNHSDLQVHMYTGADHYITYGFLPFVIELDEEAKLPRIRLENPRMAYPEFDRYGRCIAFAKRYTLTLGELVAQFPEYEGILLGTQKQDVNNQVENGMNLMEIESNVDQLFTTSTEPNNKLNTRELSLKISELKFKRLNLKDEFDNLYKEMKNVDKNVDMNKLSELRVEIKLVEDELAQLQAQLTGASTTTTTNTNQTILPNSTTMVNQNQTALQQTENNQPAQESTFDPVESAYHCLELAVCLLQDLDLKTLTPQLRSLCDNLILPNIGSVHEHIRLISVRALNLVCILKLELAQKYVPLLIEIINCDQKPVIIEAFKALINVIMAYSLNKLVDDSNTSINAADEQNANLVQEATSKILSVMTSLLDYDDSEISTIAVEGFCKLYMTGHILSAKLFSKLVIMYYSPLTENEVKLRACLSAFLPQFSFFRSVNQLCVEESFMITLKCLMNAPADSYLCEIDLIKVIEILFHLTNPKNLVQRTHKSNQRQIQNVSLVSNFYDCHFKLDLF